LCFGFVLVTGEGEIGKERQRGFLEHGSSFSSFFYQASYGDSAVDRRGLGEGQDTGEERGEGALVIEEPLAEIARPEGIWDFSLPRGKEKASFRFFSLRLPASQALKNTPHEAVMGRRESGTANKRRRNEEEEKTNSNISLSLTPSAPRLRAVITALDGARYMKNEMIVPATGTTLPRRTPGMVVSLVGGEEKKGREGKLLCFPLQEKKEVEGRGRKRL